MRPLAKVIVISALLPLSSARAVRILSTSPQVTEMLFQLGAGKEVVGTTSFSDYPPEAKLIPIMGLLGFPGIEATLRLRPDWVIVDRSSTPSVYDEALTSHRLNKIEFTPSSVASLLENGKTILTRTSLPLEPLQAWERKISQWQKRPRKKYSALFFVWYSPPILAGPDTFLSDLLSMAGAENLVPRHWKTSFPQVSEEWVIRQSPDVVFFLSFGSALSSREKDYVKKVWPEKPPQAVGLPSEDFARASFTAFEKLVEGERLGLLVNTR